MIATKALEPLVRTAILFFLVCWNLLVFPAVVFSRILVKCGLPPWLERLPDGLPWVPALAALVWIALKRFRLGVSDWAVAALFAACSLPVLAMTGGGLVVTSLAVLGSGASAAWGYRKQRDFPRWLVSLGLGVGGGMAIFAILPFPILHAGTMLAAEFIEKGACR